MKSFKEHIKPTKKDKAAAYVDALKQSREKPDNEFNERKLKAMRELVTKK
jgi:hypothetical protein